MIMAEELKNENLPIKDAAKVGQLADAFINIVRMWFAEEPSILSEIDEENAVRAGTEYDNCCASHDHCDANMAMWDAWLDCFGDAPDEIGESESDCALWNAAWAVAKTKGFGRK